MRILLDEDTPRPVRRILTGHDVRTLPEMGWARYSNGQLLDEAEKGGFEALITGDRSLPYQQNLTGRNIAVCAGFRRPCVRADRFPVRRHPKPFATPAS